MTATHVHGLMADLLAFRKATQQDADETLADYSQRIRGFGLKMCGCPGCSAVVPLESASDARMFGLCGSCRVRLREETGLSSTEGSP